MYNLNLNASEKFTLTSEIQRLDSYYEQELPDDYFLVGANILKKKSKRKNPNLCSKKLSSSRS